MSVYVDFFKTLESASRGKEKVSCTSTLTEAREQRAPGRIASKKKDKGYL